MPGAPATPGGPTATSPGGPSNIHTVKTTQIHQWSQPDNFYYLKRGRLDSLHTYTHSYKFIQRQNRETNLGR